MIRIFSVWLANTFLAFMHLHQYRIDLTMRAAAVACGAFHSAIILENGVTLVFGLNRCGQLGINNTKDKLVPVEVPIFSQNNIQ